MKRIPMVLQLVCILFFVMAIPTALSTWYSSTQLVRNSEHAIADFSLAELNTYRKLYENALLNLSQSTVRLGGTSIFDQLRPFQSFEQLKTDYESLSRGMNVMEELTYLNQSVDGVYSSYFYLQNADYVISTDKSITSLDKYESMDWLDKAYARQKGINGIWYPRKLDSGMNVISLVLPLNRLATSTQGTIVVNLRESQIEQYLQSDNSGAQEYYLLDSDSMIISHPDKNKLLTNGKKDALIREIADQKASKGYTIHEDNGERTLYAWSQSKEYGWLYISIYSLDYLLNQPLATQKNLILLTIGLIFAGTLLAVVLATWFSRPIRELVQKIRIQPGMLSRDKNELTLLHTAFKQMQEEEEGLQRLLNEREQDARSLAIHNLLRGEVNGQVADLFPETYFLVAVVSIDGYRQYAADNNFETRSYHRLMFIARCYHYFSDEVLGHCVYQDNGYFAIIMNYREAIWNNNENKFYSVLDQIRVEAAAIFQQSVTIGISTQGDDIRLVSDQLVEATEAIKLRIAAGSGRILPWKEESCHDTKYMYPLASERRILNFLVNRDLDSIIKELDLIRMEINNAEYVSYENILFIYSQLAGVTIKYLQENDVNTSKLFAGKPNIYATLSVIDTQNELEEYLHLFYGEIIGFLGRKSGESNKYADRIIEYIHKHYREEIMFEEMAKSIGISYSYMRKIVYEQTGKSLIDYINQLRIERAKQLLLESEKTITQIASEVGYYNVRSLNHFFRKFEGVAPSTYKADRNQSI